MAMVLICLLIAALGRQRRFVGISIILLLIDMIWPRVYLPLAKFWFGFVAPARGVHVPHPVRPDLHRHGRSRRAPAQIVGQGFAPDQEMEEGARFCS